MARPTKYSPEKYDDDARKLAAEGKTESDMAALWGLEVKTIWNWKQKFPTFLRAMEEGKQLADDYLERSLYRKAMGYEHDDEEILVVQGKIERVKTVKRYAPDTAAAKFWLTNRRPRRWRDRQEVQALPSSVTVTHEAGDSVKALIQGIRSRKKVA